MEPLRFGVDFPTGPAQRHSPKYLEYSTPLQPARRREEELAFDLSYRGLVSQGGSQWIDLGLLLRGAA